MTMNSNRGLDFSFGLLQLYCFAFCEAFVHWLPRNGGAGPLHPISLASFKEEWTSDFDDFIGGERQDRELDYDDDNNDSLSNFLTQASRGSNRDLSAVQTRLFSLGEDLIINDYVGNMGFEEVTDWEYYYENEDDPEDRDVVNPNPFDSSKPKRTRTNSGSVIRVFRGEFVGRLGGTIGSKGIDKRVLVKEFTGVFAQQLAKNEQLAMAKLQSALIETRDDAIDGGWIQSASSRSVLGRTDDAHVSVLLQELKTAPFLGILGEVNLAELEGEMDPNDFYRALGVPPPKTGAIWIVYEYQGLNTIASYTSAAPEKRRAKQPPKKSFWGGFVEPPPLPKYNERVEFVVRGIMFKSLSALATYVDRSCFCVKRQLQRLKRNQNIPYPFLFIHVNT